MRREVWRSRMSWRVSLMGKVECVFAACELAGEFVAWDDSSVGGLGMAVVAAAVSVSSSEGMLFIVVSALSLAHSLAL